MKKPITIIIFSVLFWLIQSSLPSYAKTVPGISGINKTGFCCINANLLSNKTKRQCDQLKGVYYLIGQRNKARKACQAEEGFCCVKGKLLSKKNKKECKQLRGKYYSPKLIKQAKLNCRREKGFCCVKGKLQVKKSEKECKKLRGTFYPKEDSTQAKRTCRPEKGFCCVKGKLQVKKSEKECKKLRGTFYPKEDSTQAKRTCRPEKGFCCVKGKLQVKKSEKECKKLRGTFYPKEDSTQAKRTCRPEKGFCCVKGKLQTRKSEKECGKLRGKFYPKKDGGQAKRACNQKGSHLNNKKGKKVTISSNQSQLKKNTFPSRKKETAKNGYGAKKFGNNQMAFSADKVIGKRNVQNFKGAKPSIGNAKKQKKRILPANEKLNSAKFRGKAIAKQSPIDNKLKPKGFIRKSIDPGSLIYRKLKTHKLIKSGPSSEFKEKTVEIKKNHSESLGNITKKIFVNQEKFQKVLLKIKPSSGILTKPPVQKNETYEFDDSFLIVKSTGIVVSDPKKLAEKSPQFRDFLGSKNKGEIIFSKLNSESQDGLLNLMKNELPKRPKDDPLRIAADKGGMKGLLRAIAEGKGIFEMTEEIVIAKKPPPVYDGIPQSTENIISHSKFSKDMLSGRKSDFIINVPPQSGSTSRPGPITISSGGHHYFHAEFMTGFTLQAHANYQKTWKWRGGLFRVMMEAGYTIGLRIPIEVNGKVDPKWIKMEGRHDARSCYMTDISAKPINGDCSFYRNTGLTGESASTCGKELALNFYYGYGVKFRAFCTTLVDIDLHRVSTPTWSQDFTPPFNNGGGPVFWIPAEITHSVLEGIPALTGYIEGGFKISGTGKIHFDYDSLHGNEIFHSRGITFINPSPVRIANKLEPMALSSDTVNANESYGFKLYNPEYIIRPEIIPGVRASVRGGYKRFSRRFSVETWLPGSTCLNLRATFTRHRGTNSEFSWQDGRKFFEKK